MTIYADPAVRPRRAPIDEDYDEYDQPSSPKHRDPLWAKLCLILGSIVMVVSGGLVVVPKIVGAWATGDISKENLLPPELVAPSIEGPINILLLGMDQRKNSTHLILTDTIMIAHIPASHDAVYLVSIPRDSKVEIPRFDETDFRGGTDKINAAFAVGNRTRNDSGAWVADPSTAGRQRGVKLVAQTINGLVPGGMTFNAVAIINFEGFNAILTAIGGVRLCLDEEIGSIHFDKNNKYHTVELPPNRRKIYPKGCQDLTGAEALDVSRQRKSVTGGDYGRQNNQQKLLMAIFAKLTTKGVAGDIGKLTELQKVAGDLLTMDLGPNSIESWVYTLRAIRGDSIVPIRTNGGTFSPDGDPDTSFEVLSPASIELLQHVRDDKVFDFLSSHPTWIGK